MEIYPAKIILWAIAGQKREGYIPPSVSNLWRGSVSYRNRNPLNLRMGSYTVGLGSIGVARGNFLVFPDYVTGFFAGCKFLKNACEGKYSRYNPNGTLADFYSVYAPSSDNNDPISYANEVADFMRMPHDSPIKIALT